MYYIDDALWWGVDLHPIGMVIMILEGWLRPSFNIFVQVACCHQLFQVLSQWCAILRAVSLFLVEGASRAFVIVLLGFS